MYGCTIETFHLHYSISEQPQLSLAWGQFYSQLANIFSKRVSGVAYCFEIFVVHISVVLSIDKFILGL